jgi:hypothetical protein
MESCLSCFLPSAAWHDARPVHPISVFLPHLFDVSLHSVPQ